MNQDQSQERGQIFVLAVIVVALVLINTLMIIGGSQLFAQSANYSLWSDQAMNLAEAGIDKALNSLNSTSGSYSGETETAAGDGSFTVAITSPDPATKVIESTGYVPSKTNLRAKRIIRMTASKGVGVSFSYGVQVGEGGLKMSQNSTVNGSVYSNGSIEMESNARITGDAYVAGGMQPTSDQQNGCSPPNCTDFIFGTSVGGNSRLDVAQSFKPSTTSVINKVTLKLKKTGSPSDIIVRLLADNNGVPDKNNVLTSVTLTANLVTNQYGLIEAAFNTAPLLSAGTVYWIMLDTSFSSSNYWSWSADSSQGYTRGSPMWSADWQARPPVWNSVPLDLEFGTFMGGAVTSIQGSGGANIGGDAHANTLQNLTITKGAYYQVMQNITAGSYNPGSADPPVKTMPVSDANITAWKSLAQAAGIYNGDISSCRSQLGPGKYVGNVTLTNNCTVTIKDPVWITGNLTLSNNAVLKLDYSYGAASGIVVADGTIVLSNNVRLQGSGTAGSYLMALSAYDSRTTGIEAIDVSNGGNESVLYAPFGLVKVENNNNLNELTAWKVELENGVTINYNSGLAGAFFTSGPSGSYSLIKGTYQLK